MEKRTGNEPSDDYEHNQSERTGSAGQASAAPGEFLKTATLS
jgi:hypothetical protein